MTVVVYPAVVTSVEAGSLQARFTDFPDLEVVAIGYAELIRLARERLSQELQRLETAGETWPKASEIGAPGAGGATEGGSIVLVDVSVDDTPIRLTISIGERLLKRIDEDAAARAMTRSGYLAFGARRLLGDSGPSFGASAGGETGQKLQEEIAALGRRVTETLGPNSPVGRTLAELDAIALDGLRRLGGEVRSAMSPRRRPAETETASPDPADASDANRI